jgi:FkbM family methyltransferase
MTNVGTFRTLHSVNRFIQRMGLRDLPWINRGIRFIREQWFKEFYDDSLDALELKLQGFELVVPRRFVDHYVFNEYEPLTRNFFLNSLRPGAVVIDVGAHIGYYTLLAAKAVGPKGRVHAVEPWRETVEVLRRSVYLNDFRNVEIHALAAGKERAQRAFHVTGSSDSHGFYHHPNTATLQTIEVTQTPLDEIIHGRVDFVKIDVEGAEIEVLEGMTRILKNNPRMSLCAEWFPAGMRNAGYAPLDLPRCLRSLGFGELRVIAEADRKTYSIDEAARMISSEELPRWWYANLWAEPNV